MKLKGDFILREVVGETVAIPVGDSLLNFNGMICINAVGEVIWRGLQGEKPRDEILEDILEKFDVTREEAAADMEIFLLQRKECDLLQE